MIFAEFRCLEDYPHFWPATKFRGSKSTLRFDNLLGGLTEITEIIILMVTVYYIKRVQISQPREEVPSPGKVHGVFSCPLPVKLWAEVTSPTTMYDTTHEVLPTREAYLSLSIQFLLGLQSHRHGWPPMWLTFSFQAL